jgi:SSS family solute:Na+ symporter
MDLGTVLWIITIVLCGFFLWVSWRVQGKAGESFSQYAIGGGNFPLYLILFTEFATIMGVGNCVGHAGRGYTLGLPWMSFILGEQGSKIIFALLFAGIAGRFTYNTVAEMADDLFVRDKWTRAIAALLACSIMIAWTGGQGKAFGTIFNIATGADPIPIIVLFSAVFIVYTALGGIHSVVWTDLFQGIIVLVLGIAFYYFAFEPVNWSFTELGNRLTAMGKGDLWSFSKVNPSPWSQTSLPPPSACSPPRFTGNAVSPPDPRIALTASFSAAWRPYHGARHLPRRHDRPHPQPQPQS